MTANNPRSRYDFDDDDDLPTGPMRLRTARLFWLPLFMVFIDGLLLLVSLAVAVVVVPVILVVLLVLAILRLLIATVTRGKVFGKPRAQKEEEGEAGETTLAQAQRQQLAMQFRPSLSLFPEAREFGPPYRTDETADRYGADYHPRSVNIMLRHVRLRSGRWQWLPDMPGKSSTEDIRNELGKPREEQSSLEIPWLHGGNPLKIVRHLFPFGRQFRAHWSILVPKAECGCSIGVWERYMRIIETDRQRPPRERLYPHEIYARVLEGRELPEIGDGHPLSNAIAIQYWWFLFYNDAWNRHQGDWEGITLFVLPRADGTYRPLGAAYGAHDLGRWRRWQDLQRVNDAGVESRSGDHPMVFVARGSHASYFDHNPNGYHPSMTRKLRVPFLGDYSIPSQFVLEQRNAIDWVADPQSGAGNGVTVFTENVKVMPTENVLRDLAALKADDDWWWMAYQGLWGSPEVLPFFGGSGPRGPRGQGIRWTNPFRWVMRECIADDLPYWVEMFSSWEGEGEQAPRPVENPLIPQAEAVGPTGAL